MQWELFLLTLFAQPSLIVCHLYEYHCINEEKNWTEAQQYCKEKHTDLATVSNMADMKRLLNNSAGNMTEAWIGLYDQTDGIRTWYWSLPGVEFNEKSKTTEKFYLIKEKKTWLEAQSYCREKHKDLISGMKQLEDFLPVDENVFIGLYRDTWKWSDGSSFSFRHWNLQFDDENYNSGQCAMTVFDDGGRWKNDNCSIRKPFICYDDKVILIKENKTWEDALYYCRDHYHDLVTITNLDEQRWIQEKAKKASTDHVWMGLRYACTLDLWFWVNDKVVRYKNWASGEPVDDCDMSGAMETGGGHRWKKMNDLKEFNFLCSKP
ncbi:C-type mannose receptor 2-like [Cyprinodon tularosa]|uniref:C-type mannose receptor 2-like n=1 Tax=Cyprinodon tularosa TaxID=77115 RepID=UPI0018E25712|nr:C-type mannose receptor 2-like [Cyprinodon tularosa]